MSTWLPTKEIREVPRSEYPARLQETLGNTVATDSARTITTTRNTGERTNTAKEKAHIGLTLKFSIPIQNRQPIPTIAL